MNIKNVILALADGSVFHGASKGGVGERTAEVLSNISMNGYQEILTDSSCAQQAITLAYPHIGYIGTNSLDWETGDIY